MNCTAKDIIEKRRLGYIPYYHTERKSIRFRESKDDESDKCANVETKFQSNYSDYAGVKSNDNSGANKSDRYQSTSFHSEEELLNKLSNMLPGVAKYLMSVEEIHAERIMDMLILMQKGTFPSDNICFHLFGDVVAWFANPDVRGIRYSEPVRKFWSVGYRLFHNKFLEFMRGPALQDPLRESKSRFYEGSKAKINFAVPKVNHLKLSSSGIPDVLEPGFLTEMVDSYIRLRPDCVNKSFNLSADLKKINASKRGKYGEVDLAGFESKPTKLDRQQLLTNRLQLIETGSSLIENAHSLRISEINNLPDMMKKQLHTFIIDTIRIQSEDLSDIRSFAKTKSYNLDKLLERAAAENAKEWRQTKYHYVISFVKSQLLACKELIKKGLDDNMRLLKAGADIMGSGSSFCADSTVDLSNQTNYECLEGLNEEDLRRLNLDPTDVSRLLEQKSQAWHHLRNAAAATGSTIYDTIGLGTLLKMKRLFRYKKCSAPLPAIDEDTQEKMDHGNVNETNAVATMVSRFMPCFLPDVKFSEVGCYIKRKDGQLVLVVSPDGEGTDANGKVVSMFELKCPFPKKYGTTVFYQIPRYYATQLLAEMNLAPDGALGGCFLGCWSKNSSTFFEVSNDLGLWNKIENEIQKIADYSSADIPKKKPESSRELLSGIEKFLDENVKFVCETPSAIAIKCTHDNEEKTHLNVHKQHSARDNECSQLLDLEGTFQSVKCNIKESHELRKPKATNILVYLLADLDRTRYTESDSLTGIPVFYGFAPTAPSMDCMQSLSTYVAMELERKGLNILSQGFDGQMFRLAAYDEKRHPLTLLHVQKELFSRVTSMKKDEVIEMLVSKCPNKSITDFISTVKSATTNVLDQLSNRLPDGTNKHALSTTIEEFLNTLQGFKDLESTCTETENLCVGSDSDTLQQPESTGERINLDHAGCNTDFQYSDDSENEEGIADDGNFSILEAVQELNNTLHDYMDDTELYDPMSTLQSDADEIAQIPVDGAIIRRILSTIRSSSTPEEFRDYCSCAQSIDEHFTLASLKEIIKVFRSEGYKIEKGLRQKKDYVTQVSKILGDGSHCETSKRVNISQSNSLSNKLSKIKKAELNKIMSVVLWPIEIQKWFSSGLVPQGIPLEPLKINMQWFTQPKVSEHNQKECFTIIDPTHILTNTRCHIARNGYLDLNIKRDAWVRVAKEQSTALNIAMVEDVIDPQNGDTAQLFFSENVEEQLRAHGDVTEAEFCRIFRNWYGAMDERGHDNRAVHINQMREFLLGLLSEYLVRFPPATTHVKSIPIVTFMSLLIACERTFQMFRYVKTGTLNLRAIGSSLNETFFSSLRDIDITNQGILRPDQIPRAMSTACLLMEARLDESRGFHMKTTKRCPVYKTQTTMKMTTEPDESDPVSQENSSVIEFRSHPVFDNKCSKRRSRNAAVNHPDSHAKGALPIRAQGGHKRREENLDYDIRAGIDIDDVGVDIMDTT